MTDIDWSKAPEGATHYNAAEGDAARFFPWMKSDEDSWYFHHTDDGVWIIQKDDFPSDSDVLIARAAQPWSGDGPPPVGTHCELHISGDNWQPCEVIAMDEQDGQPVSVVRYGGGYYGADLSCLRPAKTPAQIAADEREEAIDELTAGFSNDTLRLWAIRAYDDLGYRKGGAQ